MHWHIQKVHSSSHEVQVDVKTDCPNLLWVEGDPHREEPIRKKFTSTAQRQTNNRECTISSLFLGNVPSICRGMPKSIDARVLQKLHSKDYSGKGTILFFLKLFSAVNLKIFDSVTLSRGSQKWHPNAKSKESVSTNLDVVTPAVVVVRGATLVIATSGQEFRCCLGRWRCHPDSVCSGCWRRRRNGRCRGRLLKSTTAVGWWQHCQVVGRRGKRLCARGREFESELDGTSAKSITVIGGTGECACVRVLAWKEGRSSRTFIRQWVWTSMMRADRLHLNRALGLGLFGFGETKRCGNAKRSRALKAV